MHIVGTAGHVDHGKSSLVAALTGTNPDRWLEEQLRGMTLDLGFAHLRFEDGSEAGIIDVPGHERFLHNMLAGAAGMELLVLVVAASEGVREQTIEHLQVLRYLNVRRTVIAWTKSDLVAPDARPAAERDLRERLRGTIADGAPLFALSTVSGEGIDAFKDALRSELAALPPRDPEAPAYMPIDRVFTLAGRGTIVTGTLMQGRIAVGDALALAPSGKSVRVRSLHVFGSARERALGGSRVAINVPGVEKHEIARGEVMSDARFAPRAQFTVDFAPLEEALPLLRRRVPVRAHIGSGEIVGTLVFAAVPHDTSTVRAELFLRQPVLAFPGVRFVVRRLSPKTLLGGGEIASLDATQAHDDAGDASERAVAAVLADAGEEPRDLAAIAFGANLREDVAQAALDALAARGDVLRLARPTAYLGAAAAATLLARILAELEAQHAREPWAMGATSIALSRAVGVAEPLLVRALNAFADDGRVAARNGYFATATHQPRLSAEQRAFFERAVPADPNAPFAPADAAAVLQAIKTSAVPGLPKAFDTLLVRGVFVKVGDALYRGTQIEGMHRKIEAYITAHERMTMAEFRDLIGTSRKYAVPLLEWFDSRAITVRSGDYRMLRTRRGASERSV